jgi:hypothetical protein
VLHWQLIVEPDEFADWRQIDLVAGAINDYLGQCSSDPSIIGGVIAYETVRQKRSYIVDWIAGCVVVDVTTVVDVAVDIYICIGHCKDCGKS